MITEDGMQDDFRVQEVGAQDGIDAGEGAAEVLRYQIRGDASAKCCAMNVLPHWRMPIITRGLCPGLFSRQ